jgi:hypothetical protein
MYYDDYDNIISEEDLKTDFHMALDDIIDAEVEKRLEERIHDIDVLRERQKQYDEKIAEANKKVKEADEKRYEAEKARRAAERERDNTIDQCKQSISDTTQQKLDELFGDWLKEDRVYYLEKDSSWVHCPYCHNGEVNITLPNGDKAVTKCKVCNGEGHSKYDTYRSKSMTTSYPTFIKENRGENITPYFIGQGYYGSLYRVALRDVMTYKEAEDKAKELTEQSKQKILKFLEDRKAELDKENTK